MMIWIDRFCAWWLTWRLHAWTREPHNALLLRAMALTTIAEREQVDNGVSGEYKRHLVYAQLIKEYPHTKRRHLALAIEHALQLQR